jgi:chaperonin GroES
MYDRIVVRRVKEPEKKLGAIIIPETALEKPQQGEVIAVGRGKKEEDGGVIGLDVRVGDVVLFGKYAGAEVEWDGEELTIMREDEVMGIIKRTK